MSDHKELIKRLETAEVREPKKPSGQYVTTLGNQAAASLRELVAERDALQLAHVRDCEDERAEQRVLPDHGTPRAGGEGAPVAELLQVYYNYAGRSVIRNLRACSLTGRLRWPALCRTVYAPQSPEVLP